MKSYPYCINVDWLQVYCSDKNTSRLDWDYNIMQSYEFILRPHTSRHFAEIWEVRTVDGDDFAVIQRRPLSSILPPDAAIVQLCNRELYRAGFAYKFYLWLKTYGFRYKSISRIDLCFDSTRWAHGLKPSNFVARFLAKEYLMNSKTRLSMNFTINAKMKSGFDMNSFSFGSKYSPVFTRLYNKSLELQEVKMKPYIMEVWGFNDLDVSEDVWRIEFAVKSEGAKLVHTETGELFRLNLSDIEFQDQVERLFFAYADKYFCWKINDGQKNKSRMKDLQIFPKERGRTLRPVRMTSKTDSSRSDRIFLKKLHTYMRELGNRDDETDEALWRVSDIVAFDKSLVKWRNNKLIKKEK